MVHTSTFGSNSDSAFDAIATFVCQDNGKQQTPSNVISHDITFPMTYISSLLRHFMKTRVISDLAIQTPYSRHYNDVKDIEISTSNFVGLHYVDAIGATLPFVAILTYSC
jgi:hypothetical protein